MTARALLALLALACLAATAPAQPEPRLSMVLPRGLQRGTERWIELVGDRLADPLRLVTYDEGIEVLALEPRNRKKVRARVAVAEDARLGEHRLRLLTRHGWTELRTLFVGALPPATEKEPNGDFGSPQRIEPGVTVHGIVANEDVDLFVVSARKGQRLSAEIEGIRLGMTLFDPHVAILDGKRFELASADDTALLEQDAFVSIVVPEDGDYVIAVRDSAYRGSGSCLYRLHVGSFPRPTAVYPAGGPAGEELRVTYLGDPQGPIPGRVTLHDDTTRLVPAFCRRPGGTAPSPNLVRVSPFPNVLEKEPNDRRRDATPAGRRAPFALNGVIGEDGDLDWFAFEAKKGQRLAIRVLARTLRTPLDPVINVFTAKGRHIRGNDDTRGLDSYLRLDVPADGGYVLRVRDHLRRGGPDRVYRVEVTPLAPRLHFTIPHVRRYDSQSRQWAAVPRGNRCVVLLRATRRGFGGDLELACDDLPPGVTMQAPVVKRNVSVAPVVFEAAADAPVGGRLCDLAGRHVKNARIRGRYYQKADLVRGNPNRTAYYSTTVDRLPVAVTDPAPFRVSLEPPGVPLLRDGHLELFVTAERAEGFDAPIRLRLPFRPPGVGARGVVAIPKGKTEARYPINANGRAATGTWQVAVQASARVGRGARVWTATGLADLEVAPHLVTGKIPMAVTQQGEPTKVVCRLRHVTPFEGEAELRLRGLPAGCAAKPCRITKDSKEAVFDVTTRPKSPPGRHKTLFCVLVLEREGGRLVQTLGRRGTLRIDRPRAAAKGKPAPKKARKEPARLSRLEQLRRDAADRRKERAASKEPKDPGGGNEP